MKESVELGIVYYVFAMFLIVGMVNSVNLTDGIDGLAAPVTLVIAGFFASAYTGAVSAFKFSIATVVLSRPSIIFIFSLSASILS